MITAQRNPAGPTPAPGDGPAQKPPTGQAAVLEPVGGRAVVAKPPTGPPAVGPPTTLPATTLPGTVQPSNTLPGTARPGTVQPPATRPGTVRSSTARPGARASGRFGAVRVARRQHGLATRHQLTTAGVPGGTIASRTRPGGPWQRLLPRVYLLQTGPPDPRRRALAAVLYAAEATADPLSGDTAVLTGGAALALLGIRDTPTSPADVLIRAPRRLAAAPGVRTRATSRWPRTMTVSGVPTARPVRAAADFAARTEPGAPPDRIRSVLAQVVQAGWCHPHDLHAELRASRLLHRPAVRAAAAELLAGVRSVAEGRARDTLEATDLPTPLWNARLHTSDGAFLASPDAYWPDEGVALEVDSAEYHYTRDAWQATLRRRLRLESHGILVVSATPSMLRDTPAEVLAALRTLLALAGSRPTPPTARARGHQQLTLFPAKG
ncbi:hypothetical protein [Streptomyces sp. NPDC058623]|uniref:hypothetical protein n=1 Tax=Streptomyces sp. NPDC058623 TaxID=3346563 RepID=UPI003650E971